MQRWEYRILARTFNQGGGSATYEWPDKKDKRSGEEVVNAMGLEGWELVTVTVVPLGGYGHLQYFFKRPRA